MYLDKISFAVDACSTVNVVGQYVTSLLCLLSSSVLSVALLDELKEDV